MVGYQSFSYIIYIADKYKKRPHLEKYFALIIEYCSAE